MNEPVFPDGERFGGSIYGEKRGKYGKKQLTKVTWECEFSRTDGGRWLVTYVADEALTHIIGVGDTPREAFENLLARWALLNGGVQSDTIRELVPYMRSFFTEDGGMTRQTAWAG